MSSKKTIVDMKQDETQLRSLYFNHILISKKDIECIGENFGGNLNDLIFRQCQVPMKDKNIWINMMNKCKELKAITFDHLLKEMKFVNIHIWLGTSIGFKSVIIIIVHKHQ